jgi:hypothetical protein
VRGLLLIRGLGHSGSTVLDLALGSHPAVIGLGEAVRLLHRPAPGEERRGPAQLRGELRHGRRCTCGEVAHSCPVWGPLLEWLPAHDDLPLEAKVLHLVEQVKGLPDAAGIEWLVDSYQDDLVLPRWRPDGLEIRLLFLVRDARSWVHSRSRDAIGPLASWRTLARWWRVNRRIEAELQGAAKPLFVLGYEELALAPEAALARLCAWLDLPFAAAMLTPGEASRSHVLSGNRMRFDPERRARIRYDGAWLASQAWVPRLIPLLPPVAALQRRLVYGNRLL